MERSKLRAERMDDSGKVSKSIEAKFHSTMDAKVWAQEFMRLWEDHGFDKGWIDEGQMIGWFANSIMCGWDHAHQKLLHIEQNED